MVSLEPSLTESAVLDLSDHIMGNSDRGNYTVATFLDLSKAFDTLNRSILIRNFRCYNIKGRALEWLVSYFSQRKQFVNILDVSSSMIFIDIGIAQGDCLGHLMFIVYLNDIVRCSIDVNFLIYADDTTLFVTGVDNGQCISILIQSLFHVYRWLHMNKLSRNVSKTNYVISNGSK